MVFSDVGGGYSVGYTGYDIGEYDPSNDPHGIPLLTPEEQAQYDPAVWGDFWTFNGRGNSLYGVPKETFYLAYQKSDFNNPNQATHTVKMYVIESGQITVHRGVTVFEIIGFHGQGALKQVQNAAIIKAKIWLVNRYANYPYDMGNLDWRESVKWAESYVNGDGNTGAWGMAILAAIGIMFLM